MERECGYGETFVWRENDLHSRQTQQLPAALSPLTPHRSARAALHAAHHAHPVAARLHGAHKLRRARLQHRHTRAAPARPVGCGPRALPPAAPRALEPLASAPRGPLKQPPKFGPPQCAAAAAGAGDRQRLLREPAGGGISLFSPLSRPGGKSKKSVSM